MTTIMTLFGEEKISNLGQTKVCIYCGEEQLLSEYHGNGHYKPESKGGEPYFHNFCKTCKSKRSKLRSALRKVAPPKPDSCSACHGASGDTRWVLDEDHVRNVFRGHTCDQCNSGGGKFGDNLDGVWLWVCYLLKHEQRVDPDSFDEWKDKIIKTVESL